MNQDENGTSKMLLVRNNNEDLLKLFVLIHL